MLKKLNGICELSQSRQQSETVLTNTSRIDAFLARREQLYQGERTSGDRRPNQDAITITSSNDFWHATVADGVGGLPYGEIAATQATRFLHHYFFNFISKTSLVERRLADIADGMLKLIEAAHHHVLTLPLEYEGAATTVCGCFLIGKNELFIYSVGDSTATYVPTRQSRSIGYSKRHSFYESLIQSGQFGRIELQKRIEHIPMADGLLASIGGGSSRIQPFLSIQKVAPGDQVLLYTDGLEKLVGDRQGPNLKTACDLRSEEYGRNDALVDFLCHPEVDLSIVASSEFRVPQQGPDLLIDDTAVVRIQCLPTSKSKQIEHQETTSDLPLRPHSKTLSEIVPQSAVLAEQVF